MVGLALALLLQVQDVDAWIADLGSDNPERRDAAVHRLIEAAEAAEPALREAAESRDPDIAARAKTALARIDFNRRAAGIVGRVPPKLQEMAPQTIERLAAGDEESLLRLVAELRGVAAPEEPGGWVEYVGAAFGEIEAPLLAPVFLIMFERMEAARAAGAPMRRLEAVFPCALYWYSDEPNGASAGSDTVIRAVSSERLLEFYIDKPEPAEDLEDFLLDDPPFGAAAHVRAMLDRDAWSDVGIELAAAIGDRGAVPRLRELVATFPDAAQALAALADTASIPAILERYAAADADEKASLAAALIDLEHFEHAASYAETLAASGSWAFHSLSEKRPAEAIPALLEWAAADESRVLSHDAMVMLAQSRTKEADALFERHFAGDSKRQDAWWAMASAGRGDELAGRLGDETPTYALRYAIECGLEGAEARLLAAVAQGDTQAVWAARDLRLVSAAPALVALIESSSDIEAIHVLAALPTDDFDRHAVAWVAGEMAPSVLRAAADAGRTLPAETVRPFLADEDAWTRLAAARLLSDLPAVRAVRDDPEADLTEETNLWLAAHGDDADVARATEAAAADVSEDASIAALAERRAPGAARLLMRSMTYNEAVPFHFNAVAQPEVWDRLRTTKLPEGAPAWPTLEALAGWLTERGIAVAIEDRVRESFRTEHVSTRAGTVLELLQGVHSTCTNVRLLDDGTIRIETGVTARAAWLDWWAGQNP